MKVAMLGDIAFFGKYTLENLNIKTYFKDISEKLKEYDYVIGNLETPFTYSEKSYGQKSAFIKSDPKNVELLNFLNIDAVNLANNHMFDYGVRGFEETKEILRQNHIEYFGVDDKVLKIEKEFNKIAFSGYCCYSTNGLGLNNSRKLNGVNVLDAFNVENIFIKNHEEGYLNIGSFHIGQEHVNFPNYDHVTFARKLAEIVPYVFCGHHPHVIQGIEKRENSLLAYSLGNFCFDDVYTKKSSEPLIKQTEENKKSFILSLEIVDNNLVNYEAIPIYARENKLLVDESKDVLEEIRNYSNFLKEEKDIYISKRNKLLDNFIENRKKTRDLNWYFKRLNFSSLGIILNSKRNQKRYRKYITNYNGSSRS